MSNTIYFFKTYSANLVSPKELFSTLSKKLKKNHTKTLESKFLIEQTKY